LTTSHNWSIQPCSARYTPTSTDSATSTEKGSVRDRATDPRIIEGLDWVVKEVAKRVYYGTQPGFGENDVDGKTNEATIEV